ncbi:pyridoxamine 5'-phosphate oxidase family protein [Methanoculleus sp. 7T]|jgi:hypothetical protein|uniref:pyridoxamine 5'-phosphate oxidase family protein n=1 Tax=Methanoculleus sp. 7T TaxID=2937282 RepID=UPI0020BDB47D|nr:pyridoxamine 5'-phosphate oxidase family protein [Methanoculleus sp. 7T]MCK8519721.1 pyridoxamine 5'-phosphate oxidase family protein [Methanoculleus sp. 7T]
MAEFIMPTKLMEYFNKQPRIGVLSTSNKNGKVDAAVFGSPQMTDEKTVVVALGKNRTFEYLQENPNAVFTIVEQGETIMDWKGVRVYLRMKGYATSGEMLDAYKRGIARVVGEEAAAMVHAVVTFDVGEVRPLVDMGQGWERSI